MLSAKSARYCTTFASERTASQALKALHGLSPSGPRAVFIAVSQSHLNATQARAFSSTPPAAFKDVFPAPDSPGIKKTPAAWPHPRFTEEEMRSVTVEHRQPRDWSDSMALNMIRFLRWGMDTVTFYKEDRQTVLPPSDPRAKDQKFSMNEGKYLIRNLFLESVAGVPGIVGGMIRHLNSMRGLKRDNGW